MPADYINLIQKMAESKKKIPQAPLLACECPLATVRRGGYIIAITKRMPKHEETLRFV